MYNEDLKKKFINHYTRNESHIQQLEKLFNTFERYEKSWGADLCTQSTEVLQESVDMATGIRMKSITRNLIVLKEYVKWCIETGVPGACDGMLHISDIGLDKIKLRTVAGPAHLQQYLDSVLAPAEDKTTDCIYRCYLWLAYCGMDRADIFKVRCSDVDLTDMTVAYGYDKIPLYRESFAAFRTCATEEFFAHGTPGTPGYRLVKRIDGDFLIRGVRSMIDEGKMHIQLARKASQKFGKDGIRISYSRARLSGIFYRIYERERMGIPADFSEVVAQEMEGKEYSTKGTTLNVIRNKLIKDYSDDYERWKAAYSI